MEKKLSTNFRTLDNSISAIKKPYDAPVIIELDSATRLIQGADPNILEANSGAFS